MKTPVTIEKCKCGDKVCKTYGLSVGNFYQGCGFDKETATAIAGAINKFADDPTYETEYAGRMETACRGCDNMEVDGKIKHANDCPVRMFVKAEL